MAYPSTAGRVIAPRPPTLRALAQDSRLDARALCAMALAGYLRTARFVRWGGPQGQDVTFELCSVLEEWPDASQQMEYPSASIVDVTDTEMLSHNLTPSPLEDTLNVFAPNSVLWKLNEVSCSFQVDFWTQSLADREAIAASLPGLFSPGEDQAGVILSTTDVHYCVPVRATLENYRRVDTSASVYQLERRLVVRVRCDVDVVELRCATELMPRAVLSVVTAEQDLESAPLGSEKIEPGCS